MKNEQKMFFLQNIDDLNEGLKESNTTEYEVLTDAYVVGDVSFGPYYFTVWEMGMIREGEKQKMCLRVKETLYSDRKSATKNGFYHGGGIAEEIIALSSLALHKRFILGTIVRINDIPTIIRGQNYIDESLVKTPVPTDVTVLFQFFELIKGLSVEYHLKFIFGCTTVSSGTVSY